MKANILNVLQFSPFLLFCLQTADLAAQPKYLSIISFHFSIALPMKQLTLAVTGILVFYCWASGQNTTNQSSLTIPQIMQGDKFVGYLPSGITWSEDSRTIHFRWNPDMDTLMGPYQMDIDGDGPGAYLRRRGITRPSFGQYNRDHSQKVYEKFGDIFLWQDGNIRQVTHTVEWEGNPTFSGDERKILFTRRNNLYSWDLESGTLIQRTDLRRGEEQAQPPKPEHKSWLYNDQLEYFQILEERKMVRKRANAGMRSCNLIGRFNIFTATITCRESTPVRT